MLRNNIGRTLAVGSFVNHLLFMEKNKKNKTFTTIELKSPIKNRPTASTCTEIRKQDSSLPSGNYDISPDNSTSNTVAVYCDMTTKNGTGVTVIGHDSESRTEV